MRTDPAGLTSLVDWFVAALPDVAPLDLSAREYRRGWRALEGPALALCHEAIDEWQILYGVKLTDVWVTVAVFSAATILGRLRVAGVHVTPATVPPTPPRNPAPDAGANRTR